MKIEVDLRCDVKASFFTPAQVKRAAQKILRALEYKKISLSVWLTGNRKIRAINRKFLNHDYPTDVIAFGALTDVSSAHIFLGDIVLSVDTIRRQAKEMGHSPQYELYFCLAHGILHLMGYDDKIKADRERMFLKQKTLLKKFWREKQ